MIRFCIEIACILYKISQIMSFEPFLCLYVGDLNAKMDYLELIQFEFVRPLNFVNTIMDHVNWFAQILETRFKWGNHAS